ncbi:MAG: class I SAM-dependent RNA methyltransferase [Hyphomicrobiales bacterium]|nr:MAG: class I SAM-dependent RNA methyltransferase [Hyphomicrobiales bacterium]
MSRDVSPKAGTRLPIDALGVQGDGIARDGQGRAVFVPLALPGEDVEFAADGTATVYGTPSADRVAPPCPYFTACGGCVAQHMSAALYKRWKRDIVVAAFADRGLPVDIVSPLVEVAPGSRRRAVLTAKKVQREIRLGYYARRSHDLVDIAECLVLAPEIVRALPALRTIVETLSVPEARLTVLATAAGLDIAVAADVKRISADVSNRIAALANTHRFARVSLEGNPVVMRAEPSLAIAGVAVAPPPGAFVQAVADAESTMRSLVVEAAGKTKRVADLFCGLGAFTLALAQTTRVLAIDSDKAAMDALGKAVRHAQGLKPVEPLVRDLFRDPLGPKELEGLDAVVLDPPRAGAEAQALALAKSAAPVVAYVSCNPTTLARDAAHLVAGGYTLETVTPVDQFLYSDHVEAVAVLRRPATRARRR